MLSVFRHISVLLFSFLLLNSCSNDTPSIKYTLNVCIVGQASVEQEIISSVETSEQYNSGDVVRLNALPSSGFVFTGWSGSSTATTNEIDIVIDGTKSVIATFEQQISNVLQDGVFSGVGKWKIRRRTLASSLKKSNEECSVLEIIFRTNGSFTIVTATSTVTGEYNVESNSAISLLLGSSSFGTITNLVLTDNFVGFTLQLSTGCSGDNEGDRDENYDETTDTIAQCGLSNDISIGNQTWMSENLSVTRFNNGEQIPFEPNPDVWKTLTTPAYTYFDGNIDNLSTYGLLYNWYALNDQRGIAPDGYRIPTRSDFIELTTFLGLEYLGDEGYAYTDGNTVAEQLKGLNYWETPNSNNNNTCFNALPGGFVASYDPPQSTGYGGLGGQGVFWTSTENAENQDEAFYFLLSYPAIGQQLGNQVIENNISLDELPKTQGFSIRCIMQ